jgi:hypothetical protein
MSAKYVPVRLSISAAAAEFGLSRTSMKTKLSGIPAGDDERYSIKQVCSAVFSDLNDLRAREIEKRTEHYELRNQAIRGNLLDRQQMEAGITEIGRAITNIVKGSNLSPKDKEDIMRELRSARSIIGKVADKQRKEFGFTKDIDEKD